MQLRPEYPVVTPRLRLRPLTMHDVGDLVSYRGRAEVCRFLPFEPMSREVVIDRLQADLAATGISREGQALTLGAELTQTGRLIGDVVLFFRSEKHAGGELGYVFHPDFTGQGYAFEACSAVLGLGFEQLGLHRVMARLDARNHASAALAERLGMRREAHLVSNEMFKGEWSDELIYALLAEEWPDSAAGRRSRGDRSPVG